MSDDPTSWGAQPSPSSNDDPSSWGAKPADAPASMGMGDMLSQAVQNAPSSAMRFGSDLIQPIMHPIDTAKAIGNVSLGAAEKLIPGGEYPHEKYANAVGEYFKNRYGGLENAKRAFAQDPVGVMSDASMLITGGGSALARLPGTLGKVGDVASTVGRAIDPVMAPVNAVKAGAKTAAELGTHTGASSLENAFQSGVEGGTKGEDFREAMRGQAPLSDVVDTAREAVGNMKVQRGKEYVRDMSALGQDQTILDFAGVDKAMQDANKIKTFKGVDLAPKTAAVRQEINETIDAWKALDPAEYHTPVGFDALKQQIGDIRDHTQYGTPERVVADKAYNAIRGEIAKQAPEYAGTMKAYEKASDLIKEMEQTLSLKPGANVDTSLRKLQSIMRNNVNTNYGRRLELGQMLEASGAKNLMAKLSGQSLNHWFPRGLGKLEAAGAAAGAVSHPMVAAALPFMSPRLMGEATHLAGRTVGRGLQATNEKLGKVGLGNRAVGDISYEAGRIPDEMVPQRARGGAVHNHNPTEAQKKAGNYSKTHRWFQGLDITLENLKGHPRSGIGKDGKRWSVKMPAHYGYIKRTEGADGDHVDCYIGPNDKSDQVFVVDQKDAETGRFDEHKCLIGFNSEKEAVKTYRAGFSDGKDRVKHVQRMTMDQFRKWLDRGDTSKPIRRVALDLAYEAKRTSHG